MGQATQNHMGNPAAATASVMLIGTAFATSFVIKASCRLMQCVSLKVEACIEKVPRGKNFVKVDGVLTHIWQQAPRVRNLEIEMHFWLHG